MVMGTHAKMLKSLLLLMTTILLFPSLASAQTPQAPKPGDYEFVYINVFEPSENVPPGQVARPPRLAAGSSQIRVEPGPAGMTSCVVIALGFCISTTGGISGIRSDPAVGQWTRFPDGKYLVEIESGGAAWEGGDPFPNTLTAVATFISPVKAFITQPRAGTTASGTVWVVMWAEGTTGSANVFTLSADRKQIGSQTTSSHGPVTIPWNTTGVAKGAHTLTADVLDAAGNTGSTTLSFVLQ
jgi:hypothetical protein